jgi:hypothetical protein
VSKRRGVKVYGGQPVNAGGIIIRQLGTKVGASPPRADIVRAVLHCLGACCAVWGWPLPP